MNTALNIFRKEIRTLLDREASFRPAVLRRSLRAEYLYVTDLPLAAGETVIRHFTETVRRAGWDSEQENGWIHLRPAGNIRWTGNEMTIPEIPEALCCLSLLKRHQNHLSDSDGKVEMRLIKAAEEGREAFAQTCRELHHEWAEALRKHHAIPDIDPEFLGG